MRKIFIVIFILSLFGCASNSSQIRPESYYGNNKTSEDASDLFGSGSNLTDVQIEQILNYRLKIPAQNRIAILKLSTDNYWRFYSSDFTQLTDSISKNFIGTLLESDRVYDASFLPSMLVPEKRTVPFLREAAARFQADLLLVYRSKCQSYQKYKLVSPDQTKTYCSVEAALLDIRRGIVPFTSVSTNNYTAEKSSDDVNFYETKKKAELEAIGKSLGEIAKELKAFLSKV